MRNNGYGEKNAVTKPRYVIGFGDGSDLVWDLSDGMNYNTGSSHRFVPPEGIYDTYEKAAKEIPNLKRIYKKTLDWLKNVNPDGINYKWVRYELEKIEKHGFAVFELRMRKVKR